MRKQQENEARIRANNEARRLERERKFKEREQQRVNKKQNKEELIFRTVFTSPLISEYARPYEASLNFSSSEVNSEETLIAWCNANLFTEEDPRDLPVKNFSFKPATDNYDIDINDKAMVVFTSINTNKIVNCCKLEYDALHDKYISVEFGVLNRSPIKSAIGSLNSKISDTNANVERRYDILDSNFEIYVQKELEAHNELYRLDTEEFRDEFNTGLEEAEIKAERYAGEVATSVDKTINTFKTEVNSTIKEFDNKLTDFDEKDLKELRKKIEETKQIAETTVKMVGTDDSVTYNKNRLGGDAEREIPLGTAYIELSHNGDGFEIGKEYTISWEAECRTHDYTDIKVVFNKPLPFVSKISLVSKNGLYPVVEQLLEKGTTEVELLHVYNSNYSIILSDWLRTINSIVEASNNVLNVNLLFREIADANDRSELAVDWQGEWDEQPQYILDGDVN